MHESDKRDEEISALRSRLEDLAGDHDELMNTKLSLDEEISVYRQLLEGEEKRYASVWYELDETTLFPCTSFRQGLKQIAAHVEYQPICHESYTRTNLSEGQ